MNKNNNNFEIEYPHVWIYKIIGTDRDKMSASVSSIFNAVNFILRDSNRSSTGKYCSLEVELTVASKDEQDYFYHALSADEHIKIVL